MHVPPFCWFGQAGEINVMCHFNVPQPSGDIGLRKQNSLYKCSDKTQVQEDNLRHLSYKTHMEVLVAQFVSLETNKHSAVNTNSILQTFSC